MPLSRDDAGVEGVGPRSGRGDGCPPEDDLAQFVARAMSADDAGALVRHLDACAPCRRTVSVLAATAGIEEARTLPQGASPEMGAAVGQRLGRFTLTRFLGRGAMGEVWAARDPELEREVAVKLLRLDATWLDADGQVRLRREAQALARLSHPNVVRIYELGSDADVVFCAMELIDGETLRQWLSTQRSWPVAVEVLLAAGRGVAAAHAAGLVHRDVKPDNVMIARDGRIVVTDFGLAKLAGPSAESSAPPSPDLAIGSHDTVVRTGGMTGLTWAGSLVGTPMYMAPEQLESGDVDALSDQFSFCVSAYEALFGARPFTGATVDELAASIRVGPAPTDRRGVPRPLMRCIVRGLAAEKHARWPTMDALLAALQRAAAAPRRRRRMMAAAALSLLVAGAFLARAVTGAEESALCTGAAQSFAAVWNPDRRAAVEEALLATRVPYAADAWRSVSRAVDGYRDGWVAMHTDACRATRVRGEQPEDVLRARMMCLEGRRKEAGALIDLLSAADARQIEKSVAAASSLTPLATCADVADLAAVVPRPADPAVRLRIDDLETRLLRARALKAAGKPAPALEQARAISEAAAGLSYRPLEAEAFLLLGELEMAEGQRDAAEKSLLRAVRAAEAGRHDRVAASGWAVLVFLVGYEKSEYARGLELGQHAAAALERVGGDAAVEGTLERALGAIAGDQGKFAESVQHFERAAALLTTGLGANHPATINALDNLGLTLQQQGEADRALAIHQRVLGLRERLLGAEHPAVADSLENLGQDHSARGAHAEAERHFRRAQSLFEKTLGMEHPALVSVLANLGRALRLQGRFEEALEVNRRAIGIGQKVYGVEHPLIAEQLMEMGILLKRLGRHDEALADLRRAERIAVKLYGPEHVDVAYVWVSIGEVMFARGRRREALAHYQRARPLLESGYGPTHSKTAEVKAFIARTMISLGKPALALPLLEELDRLPPDTRSPAARGFQRFLLAQALWQAGRDRPRALRLASSARDELAGAGAGYRQELAEVDRWLMKRRPR